MKKTLLIAAAALAAGMLSVQAQSNVYSQNIVGYANVVAPVGGKSYLINVPFKIGVSNGLNEVFGSTLPIGSQVLVWSVANNSYTTYLYDPTDPNGVGAGAPVWYLSDDTTPADPIPTVPPGLGFFLIPNGAVTNSFSGAIAISTGTSNNMVLPVGGKNYLVSSAVPYSGAVTNGNSSGGGFNLNNLPIGSQLLVWSTASNSYTTILYDPTDPNGVGAGAPLWYLSDDTTPYVDPTTGGNTPNIAIGQSFFVIPNGSYTWTTGLSN